MTRLFLVLAFGALFLSLPAAAATLDPAKDLSSADRSFCVAKVVNGGGVWNDCVTTRRYILAVRDFQAGRIPYLSPMPDAVSISYCKDFGEKTTIISIRVGDFFEPLL